MLTIYLYTFLSILVVSAMSFIGVLMLSLKEEVLRKYIFMFISLAIGALLGDALIHLIPEALEKSANSVSTSILVVTGIILFFVLEKFSHWHHHGEDKEEHGIHPVGRLVLFSDGIHNFIDGIIIGASFLVSTPVGLATALAVILHEIPQEIGDFAVLLHCGYTKARALWLNFLSAVTALLGAALLFLIGEGLTVSLFWFLPLSAGGFIYIAVADLIPELRKTNELKYSILQILAISAGVFVMVALLWLE